MEEKDPKRLVAVEQAFEQILASIVSGVPDQDPMECLNDMYRAINPLIIQDAAIALKEEMVRESKKEPKKESKKGSDDMNERKLVNAYMTFGSDSMTRSFYQGNVATLLWLPEFVEESAARMGISEQDKETTLRVLRALHLPTIETGVWQSTTGIKASSGKWFTIYLSSLTKWLSSPRFIGKNQTNTEIREGASTNTVRSNLEIARLITSAALNGYPSVPFAAYYLGSTHTQDPLGLAERLSQQVDFTKYMTPDNIQINQPKITVQYDMTPIVGMIGHPLAMNVLGQNDQDNNCIWMGIFSQTEEFSKLCQRAGFTTKSVKDYIIMTPTSVHAERVLKGDPIAVFIDKQVVLQTAYTDARKAFEQGFSNYQDYYRWYGKIPDERIDKLIDEEVANA